MAGCTRRWVFGVWIGIAILAGASAGCEAGSESEPDKSCSKDSDCADGQECRLTASMQQPVVFNPCMNVFPCTEDSNCASGMVCAPYVPSNPGFPGFQCPPKTCLTSCESTGCPAGSVCSDSGVCRLLKCDEPDGPACAAHYRCDSAAAATMPVLALSGSSVADPEGSERQAQIGCVRKLCDEPDGFVCRATWRCDPDNAPTEGSGCVPLSCSETGKCGDDNYSICVPENDGPRPVGTDLHGCVVRNCGEGYQCQQIKDSINYAYCALDSPEANVWGCVVRNCEELPELCGDGRVCDRASPLKDVFGCRALDCDDAGGPACAAGSTCQLVSAESGYHSCVSNGAGGGGSGGSGGSGGARLNPPGGASGAGSGGTAGAGSGGARPLTGGRTSTGGSSTELTGGKRTTEPSVSGVCMDRE
jgi:hypothetical protein